MVLSALGVVLLSIAIAGHFGSLNAGFFLLLEGIGLCSAIVGFFFYASQSYGNWTNSLSTTVLCKSLNIGKGILLTAFAGVNVRKERK